MFLVVLLSRSQVFFQEQGADFSNLNFLSFAFYAK